MEFNLGELYEFKEDYKLYNRMVILKGTIVKVVDPGLVTIGFEFPTYSDYFHNCAGHTKTGYGYYFGWVSAQEVLRKVKIKRNNLEAYKNV